MKEKCKQGHTVGRIKKCFSSTLVLLLGEKPFPSFIFPNKRGKMEARIV
jgi:hypothetical protein